MIEELSNDEKMAMIQAVQNGIRDDLNDFKLESRLSSYNCRHSIKWDFINTNIDRKLPFERLESQVINRGIWDFPIVFDKITGYLYLYTREKNFKKVKKERNKRKFPHYFDAFATLNNDVVVQKQQLELFNTDVEFEDEQIEKVLNLIPEYRYKINRVLICVFHEENKQLVSFKTILVDKYLNISAIDDWTELINPNFDLPYIEIDENDIDIKIKKKSDLNIIPKKIRKGKEN